LDISFDVTQVLHQARAAQAQADGPSDPTADVVSAAIQNAWQNALQKAGLRLEPRKGPVETIVVDHLEKTPSEN
jgi:uncharacterized protein (TIGR03435 family)